MYQTECVNCRSTLSFDEHDAGELIQCESCGQFFALPDAAGAIATMDGSLRLLSKEDSRDEVKAGEKSFRWNVPTLLLFVLLAIVLVAVLTGNLATKILVPVLALAAINGYKLGAARVLASFAALALAAVSAGPLGGWSESTFSSVLGTTGVMNRLIAVSTAGVVVLFGSGILLFWLAGKFLAHRPAWRAADRWSGAVLGTVQGALLVCLATWGVLVLDSAAKGRLTVDQQTAGAQSMQARGIVQLAESVRGSMFGSLAEKYNPLGEVKAFSMPSKFLKVVNHPEALAAFVEHPTVQQIKDRPSVVAAMNTLREDPKVKELIASGDRLSGQDLAAILSSPATLKLIDESELMADLKPITAEVEKALDDAVAIADANPIQPGAAGAIPPGAVSYQIHPPIQPWELTVPASRPEQEVEQQAEPVGEVAAEEAAEKKVRRGERVRPRRQPSAESGLTGFGTE